MKQLRRNFPRYAEWDDASFLGILHERSVWDEGEYKGEPWECSKINKWGHCISISISKDTSDSVPGLHRFDGPRDSRKSMIAYNGSLWKCTSRDRNGRCERQIEVE